VNYLTLYHLYDTPTEVLKRDFARFKNDGINIIVIVMYWYRLESTQGKYNQQFINNVIRVANLANGFGLRVMIDFHTLVGTEDAWSNPSYVGSGMNLILSPPIGKAYVSMVKWALEQLKVLPNIWAYALLNEPWYWPLDNSRKNEWISLINTLSGTAKSIDKRPVTIRFISDLFERDWGWDSRLINALDFISLNAYIWPNAPNDIYWKNFGQYIAGLSNIAEKARRLGKQIAITEFGYSTADDTLQAQMYQQYMDIFHSVSNLIGWASWEWDIGYDPNNPSWNAPGGFGISIPASGAPRPAYYVLAHS